MITTARKNVVLKLTPGEVMTLRKALTKVRMPLKVAHG